MSWTRKILDVYWELRPCAETQDLYKRMGFTTFEYWTYELHYLTKSTWAKDPSLPEYILEKYKDSEKIQLDRVDQLVLGEAFIVDLGMIPACFPIKW